MSLPDVVRSGAWASLGVEDEADDWTGLKVMTQRGPGSLAREIQGTLRVSSDLAHTYVQLGGHL